MTNSRLRHVLSTIVCSGIFVVYGTYAADETSSPNNMPMGESLEFIGKGPNVDLGKLGDWNISGVATAIGYKQSNPAPQNPSSSGEFSNAQILIQKNTGFTQFFIQTGYYAMPVLGEEFKRAVLDTYNTYGMIPQAFVSIVPSKEWSLSLGKLPSMGGYEPTFTYQNLNIQRGMLWGQTSSVSNGAVLNYDGDRLSTAISFTDGYFSNRFNWLGTSASYKLDDSQTLSASWTGALSASSVNNQNTPLLQNNSQIYNLIYSTSFGRWSATPYLQYSYIPANEAIGIPSSYQTRGAAILTNYRMPTTFFDGVAKELVSLPFRVEYINASGSQLDGAPSILYGAGSSAWSFTLTPTYQINQYFVRVEVSYVQASNTTSGLTFGYLGNNNSQARAMMEVGILY